MSGYLQWIILTAITGSPLGSAVGLLLFWFVFDRFTFGVLPDPVRWVMRWRRAGTLERLLRVNPHDGRARLELAQLYVQRGKGRAAVDVLRPNLERGDDDVQTVVTMGEAPDAEHVVLKLVPRAAVKSKFDYKSMTLTVDKKLELPVKVELNQKSSDVTTISLTDVQVNSGAAKIPPVTPPTGSGWTIQKE